MEPSQFVDRIIALSKTYLHGWAFFSKPSAASITAAENLADIDESLDIAEKLRLVYVHLLPYMIENYNLRKYYATFLKSIKPVFTEFHIPKGMETETNYLYKILSLAELYNIPLPDVPDCNLLEAIEAKDQTMVSVFLNAGADPNLISAVTKIGTASDSPWYTTIQATPLEYAVSLTGQDEEIFYTILNHPRFIINQNTGAAILKASSLNKTRHVSDILAKTTPKKAKANALTAWYYPDSTNSPLHYATRNQNLPLVKILLEHGANANVKNKKTNETPLSIAAIADDLTIFNTIVNDPNFTISFETGIAILFAAEKNALAPIQLILSKAPHQNLLSHSVNYWFKRVNQDVALHLAVRANNVEMVKLLLDHGANPNLKNADTETPLSLAIIYQNNAILDAIVTHPRFELNSDTGGAILSAVERNDWEILERIFAKATSFDDENNGINIWRLKASGDYALHIAVKQNQLAIVRLLLQYGAHTNLQNNAKETPLSLARNLPNQAIYNEIMRVRFGPVGKLAVQLFKTRPATPNSTAETSELEMSDVSAMERPSSRLSSY